MSLVTFQDVHAPAKSDPSRKVYQLMQDWLNGHGKKTNGQTNGVMPPDGALPPAELNMLNTWISQGAPDCGFSGGSGGSGSGGSGGGSGGVAGDGGFAGVGGGSGGVGGGSGGVGGGSGGVGGGSGGVGGGSGGVGGGGAGGTGGGIDPGPYLSPDGKYFIKEPPGTAPLGPDAPNADYCFNIVAHNAQTPLASDKTPFNVRASEFYHMFQYKVPYDKPAWALSTRPIIDNRAVLHHWLLFQMGGFGTDGSHADEIGLQINNALLTGWAPGGNPLDMPPGTGLEMPAPGGFVAMENHYFNTTGGTKQDRSGVRLCVTFTQPQNPASLTWLGTEFISIPARATGTATGTCSSWKNNVDVHIFQTVPHMHQTGSYMKTVVNRTGGGGQAIIVDKPFAFTEQRAYPTDVVVHPGDTMTTTCTFKNNTAASIGFGTSSTSEMCYNFVVYYPAHALDGIGGIEGSKNMCLF